MAWRYFALAHDGDGDGAVLDPDLPLSDVEITQSLSGPDFIRGTIAPEFLRLKRDDGSPLLQEWHSTIWAEEDGQIVTGGFLTRGSFAASRHNLETTGYAGYPSGMPYIGSVFFVEEDPMNIWRHIWTHLQGMPRGNLDLQISSLLSGKKIGTVLEQAEFDTQSGPLSFEAGPVKLNYWTSLDLQTEIDKLADSTPFEYRERHQWNGDNIDHFIDAAIPKIGRRQTELRHIIGDNIAIVPDYTRDGTEYANEILGLGAGQGRTIVMAQTSRNLGGIRRVAVVQDKNARNQRELRSFVEAHMSWRANPGAVSEIQLLDTGLSPRGAIKPGDEILIEGDAGWVDLTGWYRVQTVTVRPADAAVQSLSVTPTDRMAS